jgi:hydroxymethylglutaryl-CoA reductase (NADPH)
MPYVARTRSAFRRLRVLFVKTAPDRRIPRDPADDYTAAMVDERRRFIERKSGARLDHAGRFSFDPQATRGNIEHLTGVAQIPLGFAGPMLVDGEHARGEFYVPMATTEGTLVASYGRGMRVTAEVGGIKTTVVADAMQRAPVFGFDDARGAHAFGEWVAANFEAIAAAAATSTRTGRLLRIERYIAARFTYLRFNFSTGDAAGQNLSSKATETACNWILETYAALGGVRSFTLSGNMDTDKKASFINFLNTRGKRVVAEVTIPDELMRKHLHVTAQQMFESRLRSQMGAWMAGSTNNGSHAANAIAAIFIATGQDAANVAESHAAVNYMDLTPNGDMYFAVTLPSLIVATYGGGTSLATQRECLEVLDCYGAGKVRKFAEIVTATVLCGELSLGAAIVAGEWVEAHERLNRNRS